MTANTPTPTYHGAHPQGMFLEKVIATGRNELLLECDYTFEYQQQEKYAKYINSHAELSHGSASAVCTCVHAGACVCVCACLCTWVCACVCVICAGFVVICRWVMLVLMLFNFLRVGLPFLECWKT